jgi:hypothetical protein
MPPFESICEEERLLYGAQGGRQQKDVVDAGANINTDAVADTDAGAIVDAER